MGLLQSVASLAQPTNNVKPSDILMVGQQAQSNLKEGLSGITNMMANERKQTAQERADSAVAGLLSNAPKGTQDPTQFNQMLGMASTYGSQAMKDTAKNAVESAREGYKTAIQQEQFNKQNELAQHQFEATVAHQGIMEAQGQQTIDNMQKNAEANRELEKQKMELQERLAKANNDVQRYGISVQLKGIENQTNVLKWGMQKDILTLEASGYEKDKSGNFVFNPSSPKYLLGLDASFRTEYEKTRPSLDKFREFGHTRDLFGGFATSESRYYNAYNDANKFLLTPTSDAKGIAVKQQVRSLLETGDYQGIEKLLKK